MPKLSSNSSRAACTQHELKQLFVIFALCWKSNIAALRPSEALKLHSGEDLSLLILNVTPFRALRDQLTAPETLAMQEK